MKNIKNFILFIFILSIFPLALRADQGVGISERSPLSSILLISFPNGGETLTGNSRYNITWVYHSISAVNLSYSSDGGSNWRSIANNVTASDRSYAWTVPNISSSNCLIKATVANNSSVYDLSDDTFSIQMHSQITVTYPSDAGITWEAGKSYTIRWTSSGNAGDNVKIELFKGGNYQFTITNTQNDGSYTWHVPEGQTPGSDYKIKIYSASDASIYDFSDNPFTIIPQKTPGLAVSPNSLDFGNVSINHTAQQTLTLKNTGNADLSVTQTTISGTNSSDFSILSGGGSFNLSPSQSRILTVQFSPKSSGSKQASLVIESNAPNSPDRVSLSGRGNDPPTISITKPSESETADNSYTIQWNDKDDDDNAKIALYYDSDNNYSNGGYHMIKSNISEDADGHNGSYVWDTSQLQEGGPYYILGLIDDGKTKNYDYSTGTIKIVHYGSKLSIGGLYHDNLDLGQAESVNSFNLIIHIKNNQAHELSDVKPECFLNGTPIKIDIDWAHDRSPRDGIIDKLRQGDNIVTLTEIENLPGIWENNQIEVKIVEIQGTPTSISKIYNLSAYYLQNSDSGPIQINRNIYSFRNDANHIPSSHDIKKALRENHINLGSWLQRLFFSQKWKGICMGMSSTAALYFEWPETKPVDKSIATKNMRYEDWNVKKNIILYQYLGNAYLNGEKMWDANVILSTTISLIKNNEAAILGMRKDNLENGHACWAYRVIEDKTDKMGYIGIYDPNNPNMNPLFATVDFKQNKFDFVGYNTAIIWHPDPSYIQTLPSKMDFLSTQEIHKLYSNNLAVYGHDCPVRMLLTDNSGRRVGFISDSVQVNEIPGAEIEVFQTGENDSGYYYIVDNSLDYTVTIHAFDKGVMDAEVIVPISENSVTSYSYDSVSVAPNWTGMIVSNPTSNYDLQVDSNGDGTIDSTITSQKEVITTVKGKPVSRTIPNQIYLYPNYPNPFNPTTTISYDTPQQTHVEVAVFDVLGTHIRTLVNRRQAAGHYFVTWDGQDEQHHNMPSGIYICQLKAGRFVTSRKMLLVR